MISKLGSSPKTTVGLGAVIVLGLNLASIYDTNEDEEKKQGIDIASAVIISIVFATIVSVLMRSDAGAGGAGDVVSGAGADSVNSPKLMYTLSVLALVGLVVSRSLQNTSVGAADHGSQICSTVKFVLIGFILAVYCCNEGSTGNNRWLTYIAIILTVALGIAGQWVKDEDEDRKTQKGLDTAAQVVLFITIMLVVIFKDRFLR